MVCHAKRVDYPERCKPSKTKSNSGYTAPVQRHLAGYGCDYRRISNTPNSVCALFLPWSSASSVEIPKMRALHKKYRKRTQSCVSQRIGDIFPVRRSVKVSRVVRNCLTTSLKVKAFFPKGRSYTGLIGYRSIILGHWRHNENCCAFPLILLLGSLANLS